MLLFWCEYPETIELKKLNSVLKKHNIKVKVYITSKSKKDYSEKKKKFNRYSNIKVIGAWPVLPKKAGYWFSGFCSKQSIDELDKFKGVPLKVDIEPLFEYRSVIGWLLKYFLLKKPKNSSYLVRKLKYLAKYNKIIVSTFPFPNFLLKRLGYFYDKRFTYNFMFYTSFLPAWLKPLYKLYYRFFVKAKLKQDPNTYFALGLLSKGVFGNEPVYKNYNQLLNDYLFLKKLNVKNFVLYRLGSLSCLDHEWFRVIKMISDNNIHS